MSMIAKSLFVGPMLPQVFAARILFVPRLMTEANDLVDGLA